MVEDTAGAGGWIQCSVDVEGRHINVAVRRFDDDEQRRVAAEVAWFADALMNGGDLAAIGWSEFLQRSFSPNVSVTLDEQGLGDATAFWHQVFCRTFELLLVANGLDPTIRKYLQAKPTRA